MTDTPFRASFLAAYGPLTPLGPDDAGPRWTAVHTKSQQAVVIRALTAEDAERALAAARALAGVEHLGLARVVDCGKDGEVAFIVTEAVDGEALVERLPRTRPTTEEALSIGEWLAEALAAAHRAGVVHGSLSPATIVAMGYGAVKMTDTGLRSRGPDGQPASHLADQYALGLVLFEMIAGGGPVRPLSEAVPGIEQAIDLCIGGMLAPDPKDRFGSMDEVREALAIALSRLTGLPPLARTASKPLPPWAGPGWTRRGKGAWFSSRWKGRYERMPFDPMPLAFAIGFVLIVVLFQYVKLGSSVIVGGIRPPDPPPRRAAPVADAGGAPVAPAGLGAIVGGAPAAPARGLGGPTQNPTITALRAGKGAAARAKVRFRRASTASLTASTTATSPPPAPQSSGRMPPGTGIKVRR
jgi:hypothetical protein